MATKRAARASKGGEPAANDGKHACQLTILHLSDLHFGKNHRFQIEEAPSGGRPRSSGFPTMAAKLAADLEQLQLPKAPVLVCVTGDLATQASHEELLQAEKFLRELAAMPIHGKPLGLESIFVVPGNHDVAYDKPTVEERLQEWIAFHNRLYSKAIVAHGDGHYELVALHDRTETAGAFVLTINSAIYVQKGTPDQDRGHVDNTQLERIEKLLKKVPKKKLQGSIRVAMLHHHPILIPPLAEPGRNYDAIVNSGPLLELLRHYGFHVILHGHKHYPHTFTDDTRAAFGESTPRTLFVAAGGSLGSTELPDGPSSGNTYNRIRIKVHDAAGQWRVAVETRRLRLFSPSGRKLLPHNWSWETIDEDDRSFFADARLPPMLIDPKPFDPARSDKERAAMYGQSRGNMPVVEVLPSMMPGQAYEARAWIVGHKRAGSDAPVRVTWSAGKQFQLFSIKAKDDPLFCAAFHYWGPMLLQATMEFQDGTTADAFVYARLPETYPRPESKKR